MGLDSYLTKKIYIGAQHEHRNIKGSINLTQSNDNTPIKIDLSKVSEIVETVGYWRKANAIHGWFVENVQAGIDECQKSWVDYNKLLELRKACEDTKTALDSIPPSEIKNDYKKWDNLLENLPLLPIEGFFFGSTAIDSWFYQDLEDTITIIDDLHVDGTYYYQASW
jgi:hypothetical protein